MQARTEQLPCRLTQDELIERGEALALQEKLWRDRDAKRKSDADEHKDALAKIEAESARLARIVRDREEPRPVEVIEQRVFAEGRVDTIRTDTGEVVRTRVMTEHERQMELMPRIEPEASTESATETAARLLTDPAATAEQLNAAGDGLIREAARDLRKAAKA